MAGNARNYPVNFMSPGSASGTGYDRELIQDDRSVLEETAIRAVILRRNLGYGNSKRSQQLLVIPVLLHRTFKLDRLSLDERQLTRIDLGRDASCECSQHGCWDDSDSEVRKPILALIVLYRYFGAMKTTRSFTKKLTIEHRTIADAFAAR